MGNGDRKDREGIEGSGGMEGSDDSEGSGDSEGRRGRKDSGGRQVSGGSEGIEDRVAREGSRNRKNRDRRRRGVPWGHLHIKIERTRSQYYKILSNHAVS